MTLYLKENKTTSDDISPGSDYWMRLTIEPQPPMYIEGARSMNLPVDGVIYDVLRSPQLRPLMATPVDSRKYTKVTAKNPVSRLYENQRDTDETPEEYGARVLAAICEDPDRYYQRQLIVRLEQEKIDAQVDVWQTAVQIRDARRLKVFPRNPDSCMQWSRKCDYFSVCTGITTIDDPVLFFKREKLHEELDGDTLSLLTQSSIRCYRSCPRKFYLRYELRMSPLRKKADVLRKGSSIHRGLEAWNKSGGDLEKAIGALDRDDPYSFEHEKAMIIGYHARWGHPGTVRLVESMFRMELTNPDTGAKSKTFELGGRVDVLVEV